MKKTILGISFLISSIVALACTGIIVGKDATVDGSMIMARNEDFGSGLNPKVFQIVKEAKHNKNEMFKNPDTGFEIKLPIHTYKYSIIPDSDPSYGVFGEAGFNEYGVAASTTVSASSNDEILKFDPYVNGGITEPDMASLILMQSKTAREGIELIAKIIDEKGAGEGNILYIADKNEIWYMEIYTGHQYAAVKVPNDVYAVVANAYYLPNIDLNSKDVIYSKDLINLPKKNGLLKEKDNKFHLALTYREELDNYNQIRMWAGEHKFNPSKDREYDMNETFTLFKKPDKKIDIKEVMDFFRYRYEDTKYTEFPKYRPVGIDTNLESHIFQIKDNLPSEIGGVMWVAMGPVENSVYIPHFGNVDKLHSSLTDRSSENTDKSLYWLIKNIEMLSKTNREFVGKGVKEYWSNIENEYIKNQAKEEMQILKELKKGKSYAINYANKVFENKVDVIEKDAKKMKKDLINFVGNKTEMKNYKKEFKFEK